ncbi:single-stranded DNA-binding protein [Acetobacterium carbinolicum]|uniref:single-stranded DNA-binding protein n=1 Tax=Acetobacterium TaxID=33951 RepID=UPI000DBEB393|nr:MULTISPECIES: single-stranded DNA-binding protein [unclassified Acetobacterium]AWW27359.1 single-stranded DNA-binding protein [Acetobacterium sp. KB-1]MDZ5725494.1 single-stranded DNA-binding protein [Acetobacterium sp. K1/6]
MNKVILLGRLTRDPEMKNTTTGKAVTRFSLAVDRRFKNKDGQKEADFINIVVWGKQAEFAAQYLTKGSQISLSGRLEARSYEAQDGQRRYITEVVADEINFVSSGQKSSNAGAGFQQTSAPQSANNNNMSVMGLDEDFHLMADDDDIPF